MQLTSTKTGATRATKPVEHTNTTYVTHSATIGIENNKSTGKVTHFSVMLHDVDRLWLLRLTREEAIELRGWITSQIDSEVAAPEPVATDNWSARCNCRNGHPSSSGRCNARPLEGLPTGICDHCTRACADYLNR